MSKETLDFVPPLAAEKLQNFFGVFLQFHIGVDNLDVVFPGKHIFNIHNKNDTFTVEGVNADLRHYIPTLARRSRCFLRKLENLQAVLAVFVRAYNRFGFQKHRYRSMHRPSKNGQ